MSKDWFKTHRHVIGRALAVALVASILTFTVAFAGGVVTLEDTVFDNVSDPTTTTYYYEVCTTSAPAVSHVMFGICDDCTLTDAGTWTGSPGSYSHSSGDGNPDPPPAQWPYTGPFPQDPTTGLYGLKFDEGIETVGDCHNYYFTLTPIDCTTVPGTGIKAGGTEQVTQTICPDTPTAVTFSSVSASAGMGPLVVGAVAVGLLLSGALVVGLVLRRRT